MALELMRDNIQVNALCPGYFLTDFNREFFMSEKGQNLIKKMIPMNRLEKWKNSGPLPCIWPPVQHFSLAQNSTLTADILSYDVLSTHLDA